MQGGTLSPMYLWQQGAECVRTGTVGGRKRNDAKVFFQVSSNSSVSQIYLFTIIPVIP